jgi:hypothetical protein
VADTAHCSFSRVPLTLAPIDTCSSIFSWRRCNAPKGGGGEQLRQHHEPWEWFRELVDGVRVHVLPQLLTGTHSLYHARVCCFNVL